MHPLKKTKSYFILAVLLAFRLRSMLMPCRLVRSFQLLTVEAEAVMIQYRRLKYMYLSLQIPCQISKIIVY